MEAVLSLDVLPTTKEILTLQKYNLEIIQVVSNNKETKELKEAFLENGKIINSRFLNGLDIQTAKEKIIIEIEKGIDKEKLYID